MDLHYILNIASTSASIFLAIVGFFWKADDAFSERFVKDVSLHLIRVKPSPPITDLSKVYTSTYDYIFGVNYLSWRFFGVASFIVFAISVVVNFGALTIVSNGALEIPLKLLFHSVFYSFLSSIIPCYISLLKSRKIASIYQKKTAQGEKSHLLSLFTIIFDVFLSGVIAFFSASIPFLMASLDIAFFPSTGNAFIDTFLMAAFFVYITFVILVSTFLSEIWIGLYIFGKWLLHNLLKLKALVVFLKYALPIEQKPFRSIGLVTATVGVLIYLVISVTMLTMA